MFVWRRRRWKWWFRRIFSVRKAGAKCWCPRAAQRGCRARRAVSRSRASPGGVKTRAKSSSAAATRPNSEVIRQFQFSCQIGNWFEFEWRSSNKSGCCFYWSVLVCFIWPLLCRFTVASYEGEVLSFHKITRSEMGAYLCIANNGVPPSVSRRIVVNVHCKNSTKKFQISTFSSSSSSFFPPSLPCLLIGETVLIKLAFLVISIKLIISNRYIGHCQRLTTSPPSPSSELINHFRLNCRLGRSEISPLALPEIEKQNSFLKISIEIDE